MPQNARQGLKKGLEACLFDKKKAPIRILVALSGGADSVALLCLLYERAMEQGLVLAACHVNHGIRGEEADRDEAFCKELCHKINIPFHAVHVDVPAYAKAQKKGLEESARELRYEALRKVKKTLEMDFIATAHHAEDHLETVIFHLARGCGNEGLLGIAPRRDDLIRPLLFLEKQHLLSYLSHLKQPYCTDSTNEDTDFTRNRIRKNILPELVKINPRVAKACLGMSMALRRDEEFLESFVPAGKPRLKELSELSEPVLVRYLRGEYQKAGGTGAGSAHLQALVRLVKQEQVGKEVCFPCAVTARCSRDGVSFVKTKREKKRVSVLQKHPIVRENDSFSSHETQILLIESGEMTNNTQNVYKLSIKTEVSSAILSDGLFWRTRLPGDQIRIGNMTRKIKKMLWQSGLSPEERDALPIVCDSEGPLWVPGFAVRDDLLPKTEDTVTLVYVSGKE